MNLRARLGNGMGIARNNKGFTLIEMAIVLIIIGIILGAVVKGKDLIRGAEQKKIYSKFINSWRTSYLSFYDRTGKILGDFTGGTAPNYQDGQAETNPAGGAPTDEGRNDLIEGTTGTPPHYYGLSQVGLTSPTTNTDKPWKYRYTDSEGGTHEITIAFDYDSTGKYNFMSIGGPAGDDVTEIDLPSELAMALDTIIDGEANGAAGDFICYSPVCGQDYWDPDPTKEVMAAWKMEF